MIFGRIACWFVGVSSVVILQSAILLRFNGVGALSNGASLPSQRGAYGIQVWDNVINESTQRALHKAAYITGLGHHVFSFPKDAAESKTKSNHPSNVNVIEEVLEEILTELYWNEDTTSLPKFHVEYWARQEWRHIEAHADVDENLAKAQDAASTAEEKGTFRYPEKGHVLYLEVGSNVQGPTCLFPRRSSGGDLLRSIQNPSEEDSTTSSDVDTTTGAMVELVTVPAVSGRLLQFDGRTLHAVPRPADLWLLPFVKGAPQFEPASKWGRSVILFNIWPASAPPPLDVPFYNPSNTPSDDDMMERHVPNSFSSWIPQSVSEFEECLDDATPIEYSQSTKVWLLGNERRRDYAGRTLKLKSSPQLYKALTEPHQVRKVTLKRDD
eukprot:CAMPEP_0198306376 /NCGR_PEP_ID=MMETSP1449-20131203/58384_1 /TAXON_ID=420275 /ORGANISM="Attheya septentrionalis, Strain CCMP2084" /LENGTH=382 /DNA_ID=CAMNT_0044008929 /DNA_START=88 /DNA_END=1236 /DNA_ORIENTATION=+